MFTLKLYRQDRTDIHECAAFSVQRTDNGSAIIDAIEGGKFNVGLPSNPEATTTYYDKAIVENAAGKTTEIVTPRPSQQPTRRDFSAAHGADVCAYVGLDGQPSCRLPRGHKGDHAWKTTVAGKTLAEWREWMTATTGTSTVKMCGYTVGDFNGPFKICSLNLGHKGDHAYATPTGDTA